MLSIGGGGAPKPPQMLSFDPSVYGSNPWDQTVAQDTNYQQNVSQQNQMNLQGLNSQLTAMGGQAVTDPSSGSSYPAMQNSYGLGGTPPVAGAGTGSQGSSPINIAMPDSSSRGANPWSFQGEANARGGGPPPTTPLSTQG